MSSLERTRMQTTPAVAVCAPVGLLPVLKTQVARFCFDDSLVQHEKTQVLITTEALRA